MKDFERGEGGRITQDWNEPKKGRCLGATDTAWKGLQLLADHYGDRSRAEYLERLVREECARLGIDLEPVVKSETLAA
jgi:hypothetical protein